jgi:phenylpropionate dioxygenase-like ring-hydroxylating dioxygenase large terminal subunit
MSDLGIDAAAVEQALDKNMTFPARWYWDPKIYEFELEHIFARSWQLAGRLDKLEKPGDHILCQVAHIPIIVTRDLEGQLHGFINVCRHRAHPVAMSDGNQKLLQCRYHGWTYELDGNLRRAPGCELEERFEQSEFSLVPVSVDTWGPFVFVNPDPEAVSLHEAYPELEPLVTSRGLDLRGYHYHRTYTYEIEANWKIFVENATECYHCPTIHSKSFSEAFDARQGVYEYVNVGRLLAQFTRYNPRPRRYAVKDPNTESAFRLIWMWPATVLVQDDYIAFPGFLTPLGPESCRYIGYIYVHEDCDEKTADEWTEMYNQTLLEDSKVVLAQQPGLRSNMVPHGRLMPSRESATSYFHRMVWDAFCEALSVHV